MDFYFCISIRLRLIYKKNKKQKNKKQKTKTQKPIKSDYYQKCNFDIWMELLKILIKYCARIRKIVLFTKSYPSIIIN